MASHHKKRKSSSRRNNPTKFRRQQPSVEGQMEAATNRIYVSRYWQRRLHVLITYMRHNNSTISHSNFLPYRRSNLQQMLGHAIREGIEGASVEETHAASAAIRLFLHADYHPPRKIKDSRSDSITIRFSQHKSVNIRNAFKCSVDLLPDNCPFDLQSLSVQYKCNVPVSRRIMF